MNVDWMFSELTREEFEEIYKLIFEQQSPLNYVLWWGIIFSKDSV